MRKDHDEIPQIKPTGSILNPPQLDLNKEEKVDSQTSHMGALDPKAFVPKIEKKRGIKLRWPKLKNKKIVYAAIFVTGASIVVALLFLVIPGYRVYKSGISLKNSAYLLKDSSSSQDIAVIKQSLKEFESRFVDFRANYSRMKYLSAVPFLGTYYKDGLALVEAGNYGLEAGDIVINTIEPYADIIGLGGADSSGGDSANDRIEFVIQSIDDILPRIDEISQKAKSANEQLSKIDPQRYPEDFRGMKIRSTMKEYLALAREATEFVSESKPLLEAAPYLLGIDDTRTYLLLFQNDKELRPTGGFLTAYSIINVTNGKIEPVSSNDIYNLDSRYKPNIPAPDVIRRYIRGPYVPQKNLYLRDMNWSPDFKESMELFVTEAQKAGIKNIDGVIAVDTQVVVNILSAIGAVDVPGYGMYSDQIDQRCDCPQVVYELESFADVEGPIVWSENEPGKIVFAPPNYLNRKEIVGPLMNSVLSGALGSPKEKMPALFEAGFKSVTEKHVLFYMFDEKAQEGVEAFNVAGRIRDYDGDYLNVIDANLAGRKSNLYVTHEVLQEVSIAADGTVTNKLTLTYQNPKDFDGWLNSVLPNWTRVYVPEGSEVLSIEGFEDEGEVYTELGKTVISGGFELRPKGLKRVYITYKLPFKVSGEYRLLIQKQAGKDAPLHTVTVGSRTEEFYLRTDRELSFDL